MKKNKTLKLIVIFLISILISCAITTSAMADDGFSAAGLKGKKTTSTSSFDDKDGTNFAKLAKNSSVTAVVIMRIAGVTIAVVMLLVISIKYMVSSAGERADIKKHAIVYVVGAVVLFGAVGILGVIEDFTTKSLGTSK